MKSIKRRFSPHSHLLRERNIHCALRTGLALDAGKYLQTMDHRFLRKHFAVESKCREGSIYSRNRAKLLAMLILVPGEK
jgi:hypothetical protein